MWQQWRNWWHGRSDSEQRTLLLVGSLAVAVLYWALVWDPLAKARTQLRSQAAAEQATALWLQQIQPLTQTASAHRNTPSLPADKSLLRLVDETLRAQGMAAAIERIEPGQNEREVRIWLRDASFDAMIAWLATLVNDYGLTSRQLSINQSSQQASGLVNVRIDLAES
ncbi:MAG: type II secretion system protein M [Gammaproteobacteria bacterium]|jgi:general secretion pathway protein M|nr:type II secretion system protein M [Gammaproteobacteria bacterium]